MADKDIQNAFIDGINEVFEIMFTDRVKLLLMSDETEVNIYQESKDKKYLDPIFIVAKVSLTKEEGEEPVQVNQVSATLRVPVKQFIKNNIPFSSDDDMRHLEKSLIEYDGFIFEVDSVKPDTMVADIWQVFVFKCKAVKKGSVS